MLLGFHSLAAYLSYVFLLIFIINVLVLKFVLILGSFCPVSQLQAQNHKLVACVPLSLSLCLLFLLKPY